MKDIVIFKSTFLDFVKKSMFLFLKFYFVFVLIILTINGLDIFSFLLPFIFVFAFFLNSKILIELRVSLNYQKEEIELTFFKFLFFKETISCSKSDVEYSLNEEFTSRLTRGDVFKIYFNEVEVFKRHHQLDGLTEDNISYIITELKKIGIKEIK